MWKPCKHYQTAKQNCKHGYSKMFYYVEETGENQLDIYFDANNRMQGETSYEIDHVATVTVHNKAYKQKFIDMAELRWNLLVENRMREIEDVNRRTGELERHLVPVDKPKTK